KSADEWTEILTGAGVACGPVNTIDRVLSLPQVEHDDLVVSIPHPEIPDFRMPGIPMKLHGTPGSVRLPPPTLGQHNAEVLAELGYSEAEVAALAEKGVL